jgi:hypothetical protein
MTDDFDFRDWRRPAMARGHYMLGRQAVVISDVPKLHIADEIIYRQPIIRWLCRFHLVRRLGLRPFLPGPTIEEEQIIIAAGKLFMTAAAWQELKAMRKTKCSS